MSVKNKTNSTFVGNGFIPFRCVTIKINVIQICYVCGKGQALSLQYVYFNFFYITFTEKTKFLRNLKFLGIIKGLFTKSPLIQT